MDYFKRLETSCRINLTPHAATSLNSQALREPRKHRPENAVRQLRPLSRAGYSPAGPASPWVTLEMIKWSIGKRGNRSL